MNIAKKIFEMKVASSLLGKIKANLLGQWYILGPNKDYELLGFISWKWNILGNNRFLIDALFKY
jgi:hypothetical protein